MFYILVYSDALHISKVNSSLIHIVVPLGSELSGGRIDIIDVDGRDTIVDTVFASGAEIKMEYLTGHIAI